MIRPDSGGGGSPPVDAGPTDASSEEDPPPPDAADASGPSPVLVGITPSPKGNDKGEPTAGDKFEAKLTTIAAGVRAAILGASFRDVAAGGEAAVIADATFYEQKGKDVIFNLAFVDRKTDLRPPELAGLAWDSPEVKAAFQATIDSLLPKMGSSLSALTLGRDVDVYIDAHPNEREAIEGFVEHAAAYTRGHPAAPPGLRVGAAVSFDGAAASPSPSYEALLAASDVAVIAYLPGVAKGEVTPVGEVAGALDSMIAAAAGKPILLQAVGYPSDPLAQSSPEKQRLFFETFWGALAPRRSAFAWVNVFELHDRGATSCASYAEAQGEPPDGSAAAFFCSLGLFTWAGEEKPAWIDVVKGVAAFASP